MTPFSAWLLAFLLPVTPSVWAGSWTINSSGGSLHWRSAEVVYQVNPQGKHGLQADDVEAAVTAAAAEWSLEGSWLELVYAGQTETAVAASSDDAFVVFFEEDWPEALSPDLLALTYVWSYDDGEILHFDVAVNTDGHAWGVEGEAGVNDLQNAMTHELGHALGLDHSEDPEATMYFQTAPGETLKRDLSVDDVDTFASVYGGTYPFEAAERLGCSSTGILPASGATGGLLAGLLALVGRRPRQKVAS